MVVFVDLESDEDDSSLLARYAHRRNQLNNPDVKHGNGQNPREAGFAAVLTCYPYANTNEAGRRTTRNC